MQTRVAASLQVIVQAGTYVKEEVCRALVVLVSNAPELHAYAARLAMQFLQKFRETASHSLLITSTWFIGDPPTAACLFSSRTACLKFLDLQQRTTGYLLPITLVYVTCSVFT